MKETSATLIDAQADNRQALAEQGINLPINTVALRDYLPHRYPFLLVDRVTDIQLNQTITAIKNVTVNEPFFTGHFPQAPIMPGVLMVEAMAQAAGVLAFISENKKPADGYIFLFAGVDDVRFKKLVIPGDQLIITATKLMDKRGIYKFSGTCQVDGQLVASANLTLAQQYEPT